MPHQSMYSEAVADTVLDLIADAVPLSKIGQTEGLPAKRTILKWVAGEVQGVPESFRHRYARAMEIQADSRFDDLADLARDEAVDTQRAKLIVDTEKWILMRQYRAKYGDRTALDHGNQPDNPLTSSPEERAAFEAISAEARKAIRKALHIEMMTGDGE